MPKIHTLDKAARDNRANQLNPNHPSYQKPHTKPRPKEAES